MSRIAEQVGLSQSACTRRIQALEARGLVRGYGARLDHQQLGFRVTALVDITLNTQVEENLAQFEAEVSKIDGVVECALVSGTQDYRLKIVCRPGPLRTATPRELRPPARPSFHQQQFRPALDRHAWRDPCPIWPILTSRNV